MKYPPKKKKPVITKKPIELVDSISRKVEKGAISVSSLSNDSDVEELSFLLKTNTLETVVFAIIVVSNLENHRSTLREITKMLKLTVIETIGLMEKMKPLVEKKLLVIYKPKRVESFQHDIKFIIPQDVMDFVLYNSPLKKHQHVEKNVFEFLDRIMFYFSKMEMRDFEAFELVESVENSFKENSELVYVQRLEALKLECDNMLILLSLSVCAAIGLGGNDVSDVIGGITKSHNAALRLKNEIANGESSLIKNDLIKIEEGNFKTNFKIKLTEKALNYLFEEDRDKIVMHSVEMENMIKPESISEVKLYYNDDITKSISTLFKMLSIDGLKEIQARLTNNGLRNGVAILLHGIAAGTGKTELVKQLAKFCGRPIVLLEVADIKSMWYGDSETKLKKFFTDYKMLVHNSEVCPILLMNEADQLLSSRVNIKRSVDQTANALQNILLNEIENLEGVLIATTNRIDSLDSAFMRRFLYKIKFEKPDFETRLKILKDKMSFLTDDQIAVLAGRFPDLTGGQIENLTRKYHMSKILNDEPLSLSEIEEFAAEEAVGVRNKMGFNI